MNTYIILALAALLVLLSNTSAESLDDFKVELERALDEEFTQSFKRAFAETTLDSKRSTERLRRGFWGDVWKGVKYAAIKTAINYVVGRKRDDQLPDATAGDDQNVLDQDDADSIQEFKEFLEKLEGR